MKTNVNTNASNTTNVTPTHNTVTAEAVLETAVVTVVSGAAGYVAGRTIYAAFDALNQHRRTKKAETDIAQIFRLAWNKAELVACIEEGDLFTRPHKGWTHVQVCDPDLATSVILPLFAILESKLDDEEITVITNDGIYYIPVHKGLFLRRDLAEIMVKTNAFYDIIDLRD